MRLSALPARAEQDATDAAGGTDQAARLHMLLVTVTAFIAGVLTLAAAGAGYLSFSVGAQFGLATLGLALLHCRLVIARSRQPQAGTLLSVPQLAAAGLLVTYAAYHAPEVRPLFIAMYVMVFTLGFLELGLRKLALLGLCYVASYACMVAMAWEFRPELTDLRREMFRVVGLALVLCWFTVVGGYLDRLRQALRRSHAELRDGEARYREISDLSADAYWEQDRACRFTRMTLTVTGRDSLIASQRWLDRAPWELASLEAPPEQWRLHREALAQRAPYRDLVLCLGGDAAGGADGYVSLSGHPVFDKQGEFIGYRGIARDITERRRTEDRLAYLAQFDALTGLPNRHLLHDRLTQLLLQARRSEACVGCMFLDLDRFKDINDTYGHAVGDELLTQVAERLRTCLRSGDTVGRFGGGEFVILLPDLVTQEDASVVANKVLAALAAAHVLEGRDTYVSASIGVALYPGDGEDADTLLSNAESAMYRAKESGGSGHQNYLPLMNARSKERLDMEGRLRGALARDEFLLHYQPKIDLATGAICGFEALLRWRQADGSVAGPHRFVPILEDTGLIIPVGEWVLRAVCRQLVAWRQQGIALRPVAVNVSARQFRQKDFHAVVSSVISESGLDPALVQLELTESLLLDDPEDAVEALRRLKDFGVKLSIDDFGTGFSSLAYLQRFPIDELKIDRAFIRDATTNPDDANIALTIISLAHSLRLKVVAEGVETAAQLAFLRGHACDQLQGFYFAPPLDVSECTDMLFADRRLSLPALDGDVGEPLVLVMAGESRREQLLATLAELNYRLHNAQSSAAAFATLAQHPVQMVVSDDAAFLSRVRGLYPQVLRILLGGSETPESIAEAVNQARVHKYLPADWDAAGLRAEVHQAYLQRAGELS